MAFVGTINNYVSKGIQNYNDTSKKMTWFGTNFNMPVENYLAANSPFTRYLGPVTLLNEAYSYDLSGFSPGFEVCNGYTVFDIENTGASAANINTLAYVGWADAALTNLFWIYNGFSLTYNSLPAGYYTEWWVGGNIGVAGWEIYQNANYHYRASAVGTPNISVVDSTVAITNVPSTTQLGSSKEGYIWVEGNNLCFVNANQWKHTIVGVVVANPGATPGYIWIDTVNAIHWIGGDGQNYITTFFVKQFASFYSNGATGAVFAGTSKAGMMWVDNQFGSTHIAYIGYDGYKYLTGAGASPYV